MMLQLFSVNRQFQRTLLLFLSLILVRQGSAQQFNRTDLLDQIDKIVQETMERDQVVGVSIGVMKGAEIIVAKGYGYADLENEVKATEHTVYRIGSITKQFTAVAIMQLVEQGNLKLEDDLTKFQPDYPTKGHKITIERLLNHTSGIKRYTEMGGKLLDLSYQELIDLFSTEPFQFAPGDKFRYNNSAYYLLGVIIEKAVGTSYTKYLEEHIWKPLGMCESFYLDNTPIIKNRAEGYEVREGRVVNDDFINMAIPYSAGALGSSVVDLCKWQLALNKNRLIRKESYRRMITPGILNDGKPITYGYGFRLSNLDGHRKIQHNGGINGFRTQLSYYPDDDLTIVVLCNTGSAKAAVLESRIAHTVMGIPEIVVEEVELPKEKLQIYTGTYTRFEVSVKDGKLTVSTLFGASRLLRPVGNHMFVSAIDPYKKFIFTVEERKATSLRIEREGQVIVARRTGEG